MESDDYGLILKLSAGCSLDSSPKKNWVENSGGLPNYICQVAKGVMKSGKTKSQAIAIAVSRIKKWAAGGDDVNADTRAKAVKALAQWEKLKAKNKAKNVVAASHMTEEGEEPYLLLTYIPSYKTDIVRIAWDAIERTRREEWEEEHRPMRELAGERELASNAAYYPYRWIKELWTDYIIVETESSGQPLLEKVPFSVNPLTNDVSFGEPVEVKQLWVEVPAELTENEKALLSDLH